MSKSAFDISRWARVAQAAYARFDREPSVEAALVRSGTGDFSDTQAARFLELSTNNSATQTPQGIELQDHHENDLSGFSASVFLDRATNQKVLTIRGTEQSFLDALEDIRRIGFQGFAGSQMVSMYRYYRRLTTPTGEQVSYSDAEIAMLQASRLGVLIANPFVVGLHRSQMRLELQSDTGLGVLSPTEQLVVTGHSLGGHLAILFGRLFPRVTEHVYTYNAPGINPVTGELGLRRMRVGPIDPSRVTNMAAVMGNELVSLIPVTPGERVPIFTERGSPLYQHSIVPFADSLALYEAFATLSPALASNAPEISRMISAASPRSQDSLERTLDFLRSALGDRGAATQIAAARADLSQREDYYANLYRMLDGRTGGLDYAITSLAGKSPAELRVLARSDASVRFALKEQMPFAVKGADLSAFDDSDSPARLGGRAEWLAAVLENNAIDRPFGISGSSDSVRYEDHETGAEYGVLGDADASAAQSALESGSPGLDTLLQNASYRRKVVFGADRDGVGEAIVGLAGGDHLFGGAASDHLDGAGGDDYLEAGAGNDELLGGQGNDSLDGGPGDDLLIGGAGNDVLDGGAGSDRLEGGAGNDSYQFSAELDGDTIVDRDGLIYAGATALSGGAGEEGEPYLGSDGQFSYEFTGDLQAGGTLTVNGSLRVEGFRNGDLGIRLMRAPSLEEVTEPATQQTFLGDYDYAPIRNVTTGEIILFRDPYGNPYTVTRTNPIPDREDTHADFPGTPGNDHFILGGGVDRIQDRLGGDDWIEGGAAADVLSGGAGNDLIEGGPGYDQIFGDAGDDVLIGGMLATRSSDLDDAAVAEEPAGGVLIGDTGNDQIYGGPGLDVLRGGPGRDIIFGGPGDDTIYADGPTSFQPFTLESVEADADVVVAGPGDDYISADGGNDLLFGGAGNDRFDVFGPGGYIVYGGPGDDQIRVDDTGEDDPADFVDAGPGDDLVNIFGENAIGIGGPGDDFLHSQGAGNLILGGDGDDIISFSSGGTAVGGAGNDFFDFSSSDAAVATIHWGRSEGLDLAAFYSGSVVVELEGMFQGEIDVSSRDWIVEGFPVPVIELRLTGTDNALQIIDLAEGIRRLPPEEVPPDAPTSFGTYRIEFADGSVWDEAYIRSLLSPEQADDEPEALAGTPTSDVVFGNAVGNVFPTSPGDDWLLGGIGNDRYQYGPGDGFDTIEDQGGNDSLEFTAGIEADDVEVFVTGDDYVLTAGTGGVRLVGGRTADGAIEHVEFSDATAWTAADLSARAVVLPDNRAPEMPESLGTVAADFGEPIEIAIARESITDPDRFDALTFYAITAEGERLPEWLSFDASSLTVSGTPGTGDAGRHEILLIAADQSGEAAFGSLMIEVSGAPAHAPEPAQPPVVVVPTEVVAPPVIAEAPVVEEPVPVTEVAEVLVVAEVLEEPIPTLTEQVLLEATPAPIAIERPGTRREASADDSPPVAVAATERPVGVPVDPQFREMQERFDVLLQVGRTNLGERYAEAVRQFEERRQQREEAPSPPPPTEEEIGAWNRAMHAWHDRHSGFDEVDPGSGGGAWGVAWGTASDQPFDRTLGAAGGPGLANPLALARLNGVAPAPGLREGVTMVTP